MGVYEAGAGFTAIELLLTLAIAATLTGIAIPLTTSALDEMRASMAARYLHGRIIAARLDALQRSTCVALRFQAAERDHTLAVYMDGNRNGVRTVEIASGVDPMLSPPEHLGNHFTDVRFGLAAGIPDLDGIARASEDDGVHVGSAGILTLSPDGTATSGTVYIRGRRTHYAVRVLGATGRTRIFQYHPGAREWVVR